MACPAEESLSELVAGSLEGEARTSLLAHLDGCGSCRFVVAALAQSTPGWSATAASGRLDDIGDIAPGTELGRYVIVEKLGAGGMGVVYAAHDPVLDRKVAVKLLRGDWVSGRAVDEGRARLLREGQIMARLSSAQVVMVLDVGTWRGRDFVAMELIDGTTLKGWLRAEPRSVEAVLSALHDAGRGLSVAHEAGLVHRDFKPDNVLVSRAGRVLVTDFGLARAVADPHSDGKTGAATSLLQTQSGAVVGTPAYMAPEQIEGGAVDAGSDQFSFCVTAYEALSGARPFVASTLLGLLDEIRAGRIVRGPRPFSPSLRRVLLRGLDCNPALRHPSMAALLTELERVHPARRRRRRWVGAAVLTALTVAAVAWWQSPRLLCRGAEAKWRTVWGEAQRPVMQDGFARTKLPYAADAFGHVARALDGYRAAWVRMHTETCEATRVRGEQSAELMDLRMSCLADRLESARAVSVQLARADAQTVERAVATVDQLPPLTSCSDEKTLRLKVAPPGEASQRSRVESLSRRRAEAEAVGHAGRFAEALVLAHGVSIDAKQLGYRPLEAEALATEGDLADSSADYAGADRSLHAAVLAAAAGGHLEAEATAWVRLIGLYSSHLHRFVDGHAAADHAAALAERLGHSTRLSAALAHNLGNLLATEGKLDDAKVQLDRALLLRGTLDPDGSELGATLVSLGNLMRTRGDSAASIDYHQRSLALFVRTLGPKHPRVAIALKNLGNTYWHKNQLVEALTQYQAALALQTEALGPDHPEVTSTRGNIAAVYTQQGKLAEAIAEYRHCVAAYERRFGQDDVHLLPSLNNLAISLQAQGKLTDAEEAARRALGIAEKTHGLMHPEVETALVNLGDIVLSAHRFDEAEALYRRGIAISEAVLGPKHPHTAEGLGGLGFVLLAAKKPALARPLLERASQIGDGGEVDPVNLAKIRFALAQSLWPDEKPRALGLARTSLKTLAGSGARQAPDVKEVEVWLATRSRG